MALTREGDCAMAAIAADSARFKSRVDLLKYVFAAASIPYERFPKKFLLICYLSFISSLIILGFIMKFNYLFYMFLLIPIIHLLFFQVYKINFKNPKNCFEIFKSNNFLGLVMLINILIGKIFI